MDMNKIIEILELMKSSTIDNYVLAGLSSSLIGQEGFGKVRLFEKDLHQRDSITPHSHRFNFVCLVLAGYVTNHVWEETTECDVGADRFLQSKLTYSGTIGSHTKDKDQINYYSSSSYEYCPGEVYSMFHDQIHSITFSKGAKVLFFEGPNISDQSVIIEPMIGSQTIPTYEVADWMFKPRKQDIV